jgi:hypothetical protein
MKILIGAIALAFAVPAAAQTAPSAQQQQDLSQHQQHGSAAPAGHAGHQMPQGQGGQHDQHQGHGMSGDCCADRNGNGRMDCCENMAAGSDGCCGERGQPASQPAQPQAHQKH